MQIDQWGRFVFMDDEWDYGLAITYLKHKKEFFSSLCKIYPGNGLVCIYDYYE